MSSEKQDVSASFYTILGWLETNKKNLAIGLVAVVLLSFAIVAYRWNTTQTELTANSALLKLRVVAPPGTAEEAATPADFLKVAEEFPGTSAAGRALLLAAHALFSDGKYAEAHDQFQKYLSSVLGGPLAPNAALGAAASLEAEGKTDEAISAYQNFQSSYPRSAFAENAKLSAARLHESKNQHEQALKIYEELISASATSSAGSEAAKRKDRLIGVHPELGKSNTPVSTNATPSTP